jgi:hypothetical protein
MKIMKFDDLSEEDQKRIIKMEDDINTLKHSDNPQELSVPLMRGNPLIKSFGVEETGNSVPVVSAIFKLSPGDKPKYIFSHVE